MIFRPSYIKIAFFAILAFTTIEAYTQTLKALSVQEQKEDINYIQSELEKLHPGIYTYQSKEEFGNGFDSLKRSLKENHTVFEFYKILVPVINDIGCGHTTVKLPHSEVRKIQKSRKFLPFEIGIIENKIYITKVLEENPEISLGAEIISINNTPSFQIIEQGIPLYPSDGRIQSRKYQMMERYFSVDYSMFHSESDEFNLEIKNDPQISRVIIQGISYNDLISQTAKPNLQNMEFVIIDSLSAALITIRNSSSKKNFSEFLETSFLQVKNNNIQNLILDLRYDSFNRDADGAELFSYLTDAPFSYYKKLEVTEHYDVPKALRWITHYPIEQNSSGTYCWTVHPQLNLQSPKPNSFEGKVFVLTDGFTFSATTEFSSIVKSHKRGLIVGQETGGGYYGNNSGGMLIRKLPNSKLKVVIPPLKYIMAVKDLGNYSRGVLPDVVVSENIGDKISGNDKSLKTALSLTEE